MLHVLREVIGLTGAKPGCERGECGACTVLIDGVPRYACLTLAVKAQDHEITTLEGLMDGDLNRSAFWKFVAWSPPTPEFPCSVSLRTPEPSLKSTWLSL